MRRNHRAIVLVSLLLAAACGTGELLPEGSPEDRFAGADDLLARGKDQQALEAYRILARSYVGTDWEERARIGVARAYRASEDFPAAIQEYETFVRRYPRSDWVDDAAFEIGLCYSDQRKRYDLDPDMNQKALASFNQFLADHPESDLAPRVRAEIREARTIQARKALENGRTYYKLHRFGAARFYFQAVIDDFPDTDLAPEAYYEIGRSHEKEGSPEKAREALAELQERFPESAWTARLASELRREKGKTEPRS